jgi:hypothetical protein
MSMGGPIYQPLPIPIIGGFGFNGAGRNSIGGLLAQGNEAGTKPQAHEETDIDEKVGAYAHMKFRLN